MNGWAIAFRQALEFPVIRFGKTEVTFWAILSLVVLVCLLFWTAGLVRRILVNRVLTRSSLDLGVREAIGSIVRYAVLLFGTLGILQTAGFDLTTLGVFAGAIGIGLGLGLQHITNNFISGLIILIERPIKVGDRIEIGPVDGDVVEIGGRSTRILTNDNITIIVPNSRFVTENVVNWKHTDSRVRVRIPVGVAYGTDPRLVEQVLLEVAATNPDVLADPEPKVWFRGFGDSALNFELLAWNASLLHRRGQLMSDLNHSIVRAFAIHGIEIPFPQRDVHIHRHRGARPDPEALTSGGLTGDRPAARSEVPGPTSEHRQLENNR